MSEPLVVVTSDDSSPAVVIAPVTASPSFIVTAMQGPPGPPGVTILAALPVFDAAGVEHAIRFNSDLTLPCFDANGESSPIRLISEPL